MHFYIHFDREHRENTSVVLDGEDITKKILVSGFGLEVNELGQPILSMRLKPDSVDIDGTLYVTEEPPIAVCTCGHPQSKHSGDRAQDFYCEFADQCGCHGWQQACPDCGQPAFSTSGGAWIENHDTTCPRDRR
jgi:hypothetical protein